MAESSTFAEVFASWTREDRALHFPGDSQEEAISFADLADRTEALASRWTSLGLSPGDRVVLVMADARQFILALGAALRTGLVTVPAAPPSLTSRGDAYREGLRQICRASGAALCLTGDVFTSFLRELPLPCRVLPFEALADARPGPTMPLPAPEDLTLIQFTSGSTGRPKGVAVEHGRLLAHVRALSAALAVDTNTDRGVSWLPFHHDMGLIGKIFTPMLTQTSTWYLPPLNFVRDPVGFLRLMSDVRGTISFAPNFAYGLLAAKAAKTPPQGLDLSAWRIAGCGAEPVSVETLKRFAAAYESSGFRPEALRPCYGMAEATLAVSLAPASTGLTTTVVDARLLAEERRAVPVTATAGEGIELASSGRPLQGTELRIVSEDGQELPEGHEGEVTVRSSHMALGYYADAELTGQTWKYGRLHTGDLGFLLAGELHVTGRLRDLIIVNGRNHQPHDIEQQVESVPGIRPNGSVAVAVRHGDTEALRIVAEARSYPPPEGLVDRVAGRVREQFGIPVHDVTIVRKGTLPKTSSGKKQRQQTAVLLEAGTLGEVTPAPRPATAPQKRSAAAPQERPAAAPQRRSVPAAGVSPVPAIGSRYVVRPGDTITEIAFIAYGDARRHQELALHNKDVPGFKAARLAVGMEIDIPQPDYLPMPRGLGGLRGGVGKSFAVRPVRKPTPAVQEMGRSEEGRES
ncbi:AMP-binding protein [Streptomyces sp. NPDC018833]|uniref:AMP-binding protein n=1 Tax=Streptomyces sp. NPDC018833 TaxID=3365053 RepID=UPI0037A0B8A7